MFDKFAGEVFCDLDFSATEVSGVYEFPTA